jgi:hypothetical protein
MRERRRKEGVAEEGRGGGREGEIGREGEDRGKGVRGGREEGREVNN